MPLCSDRSKARGGNRNPTPALHPRAPASSIARFAVSGLTVVGAAIRVVEARQPLWADELSTFWIVTGRDLVSVLDSVHSNDEITPPLFFVASWLTAQLGSAPELVRLPSLIAGVATIPLIYLVGLRLVGRSTGIVAAALTTFSPFMIYYSSEARSYSLMMFMVTLSTLAMLQAIDGRSTRWWVVYAVATCAAAYSHYTCVFVLAAQLAWLLVARPEARRPALLANVGAVIAFLPWISGLRNDLRSPTTAILSKLQPFTPDAVRHSLERWAFGYPYVSVGRGLTDLPGKLALTLFAAAFVIAVAGIVLAVSRQDPRLRINRRIVLVVLLATAVPVGAAVVSSFSTHLFGVRNLAASWPGFALLVAAFVCAAGPRLRYASATLLIVGFALGAAKLLTPQYRRPDYRAAADLIDREAESGDVVIDGTAVLSPGPLSPMDLVFRERHRVIRVGAPQQNDHPFGAEPRATLGQAVRTAFAAANGSRVFVVTYAALPTTHPEHPPNPLSDRVADTLAPITPPAPYRLVESDRSAGISGLRVRVFDVGDPES